MIKANETEGMIFDIQRFSVHDGPGIRSIVFFKGCPLRCQWCCNPESQNFNTELMLVKENCIDCRRCENICPYGAISFTPEITIDREKCVDCGACAEVCYSEALTMVGEKRTVSDLIFELKKDEIHYRKSNGGITLSGGEALAQPELATDLLAACKAEGWHTAIETTGYAPAHVLEKILPHTDLVLLDIKHLNSVKHREYIGVPNKMILQAAKVIAEFPGTELVIRIPVIPGFNDSKHDIGEIAAIAKLLEAEQLHLLPYHPYGMNKYGNLGIENRAWAFDTPSEESLEQLKQVVESMGMTCKIGG
ncbi:glycyl-radical enzyme activating protein [Amphibacillus sp. Q70]|uniref:glycyl-radical enzyme activating protein n=1 Tax=Amphibacillus sp. Q70 TaxID=3453416 RepID=UPI003F86AB12